MGGGQRVSLEVRVAFRVHGKTGNPLAYGDTRDGYVHEKWAVLTDEEGNRLYIAGSLNESRTALVGDPGRTRAEMEKSGAEWSSFCAVCRDTFGFNPEKDGAITAAERLSSGKASWPLAWRRYKEAPKSYPGVKDLLESKGQLSLTVFAKETGARPIVLKEMKWSGMRLKVELEGAEGLIVDIRSKVADSATGFTTSPTTAAADGQKTSLLVEDDEAIGAAAFLVVLDPNGQPVLKQSIVIGEN